MNPEKSSQNEDKDVSKLIEEQLEDSSQHSEDDTLRTNKESLNEELLKELPDRIKEIKTIDELVQYLQAAQDLVGDFIKTNDVPFSAEEIIGSVEKLREKVDQGEAITDEELQTIPRQAGLRDQVLMLLEARHAKGD